MQIGRCSEELDQYAVITALGLKVLSKYLHWGAKTPNFFEFLPLSSYECSCTHENLSFHVNRTEIEKG